MPSPSVDQSDCAHKRLSGALDVTALRTYSVKNVVACEEAEDETKKDER
jgi:hypothetical protein